MLLRKNTVNSQSFEYSKTFRISLGVTKPLNADFHEDEINCHVPQNPMATTEVKELMSKHFNILSPKKGMPIICIVHDDLSRFNEIELKLSYTGKALPSKHSS